MLKPILLSLLSFLFLSCQTIHYVNSESETSPGPGYEHVKWHHIGLWGLWEASPPVRVKALCGDKGWKAVRTRTHILQIIAVAVVPLALQQITSSLSWISFYSPEEVSVKCGALSAASVL